MNLPIADPNGSGPRGGSHIVVCGLGPLGESVARVLSSLGLRVVGVDSDPLAEEIEFCISTIEGDPTSEEVLREARIERASALISTIEGDDTTALLCLTVRALNPDVRLVVRGESAESERILRSIGADRVVCPEIEAGRALARAMFAETTAQIDP